MFYGWIGCEEIWDNIFIRMKCLNCYLIGDWIIWFVKIIYVFVNYVDLMWVFDIICLGYIIFDCFSIIVVWVLFITVC